MKVLLRRQRRCLRDGHTGQHSDQQASGTHEWDQHEIRRLGGCCPAARERRCHNRATEPPPGSGSGAAHAPPKLADYRFSGSRTVLAKFRSRRVLGGRCFDSSGGSQSWPAWPQRQRGRNRRRTFRSARPRVAPPVPQSLHLMARRRRNRDSDNAETIARLAIAGVALLALAGFWGCSMYPRCRAKLRHTGAR